MHWVCLQWQVVPLVHQKTLRPQRGRTIGRKNRLGVNALTSPALYRAAHGLRVIRLFYPAPLILLIASSLQRHLWQQCLSKNAVNLAGLKQR